MPNIDTDVLADKLHSDLGLKTEMGREYLRAILPLALLMDRKQQDYGSSNISLNGELGVMVRTQDKVSRIRNLLTKELKGDGEANNESINDSWSDLANYGVIGLLLRTGKWR
jgi:hypothetical protein